MNVRMMTEWLNNDTEEFEMNETQSAYYGSKEIVSWEIADAPFRNLVPDMKNITIENELMLIPLIKNDKRITLGTIIHEAEILMIDHENRKVRFIHAELSDVKEIIGGSSVYTQLASPELDMKTQN